MTGGKGWCREVWQARIERGCMVARQDSFLGWCVVAREGSSGLSNFCICRLTNNRTRTTDWHGMCRVHRQPRR